MGSDVIFTVAMSSRLRRFLDIGDHPRPADCIFVLAGRQARKVYGLDLWRRGLAPELILSVARYEWRRFYSLGLPWDGGLRSLVDSTPPEKRHFFVRFCESEAEATRIAKTRFGTITEGRALARLLRKNADAGRNTGTWYSEHGDPRHGLPSFPNSPLYPVQPDGCVAANERMLREQARLRLMVVSSSIHLRRVALAFRRAFGDCGVEFSFVPVPEESSWPSRLDVWSEFGKYLFYHLFLTISS